MTRRHSFILALLFTALGLSTVTLQGCGGTNTPSTPVDSAVDEDRSGAALLYPDNTLTNAKSGGGTTVFDTSAEAFEQAAPNLNAADFALHELGDETFDQDFVASPFPEHQGLGPIFNRQSCSACHVADGRGRPPEDGEEVETMLIRLSIPGIDPITRGIIPAPGFGGQLQDRAVDGTSAEAKIALAYSTVSGTYGDGSSFNLRMPTYSLTDTYIPYPEGMLISPRVSPAVFGLGLLEAIPTWAVLARVDTTDRNQDGISGRANFVFNPQNGTTGLGRFGWKSNTINLKVQAAAAYVNDMGITSNLFNVETAFGQSQHDGLEDDPEVSDADVAATAFYTQTLGVPARRNVNNLTVRRGELKFQAASCNKCHTPVHQTGFSNVSSALSFQRIQPFTDLLLHDMGPGLADNRPDFLATGQEWRTAPLWGVGLQGTVNGHTTFLHDGRARNLTEAILWHGGEAEASKEKFRKMSATDRAALLAFLNSL